MTAHLSRRQLLQHLAGAAALGTLGGLSAVSQQAHAAAGDRKFLFFFASGGWDATPLDPKFAADGVGAVDGTDMDPGTVRGQLGRLSWSAGPDRLAMDRFFARWGRYTCLLRGVDVHSAGHDSGMQWMMTGTTASQRPDWPAILAANGITEYPMPHLVFSGPSFPGPLGAAVVRGGGGTLLRLIDGSLNGQVDVRAPVAPPPMDSMMDAFVYGRAARVAAGLEGPGRERADALLGNLERAMELEGRRFEAGLGAQGRGMFDQAVMALEVMRLGLTRCAIVGIPGGWDTHGGNQNVGRQLDGFFGDLDRLFEQMVRTPGQVAPRLIDEVTIVVASELGRTPRFNGSMGRDHWPYTSMMVAGAGVRGDWVCGATDDRFVSLPVDLRTGLPAASGSSLGAENVGTALLALGGVDPERFLPGVEPLQGLLRGGS
jgi:hypothetical protein